MQYTEICTTEENAHFYNNAQRMISYLVVLAGSGGGKPNALT